MTSTLPSRTALSQISWVEEQAEVTALASGLGTLFMLVGGLLNLRWFQQLP